MATHQIHDQKSTIYFVTFTCYEWEPLFEIADIYGDFDKWFSYLQSQKVALLGYVIMPNHFHLTRFFAVSFGFAKGLLANETISVAIVNIENE